MRKILAILFFITWTFSANGQLGYTVYEDRTNFQEVDSEKLFPGLNFLDYSKNNVNLVTWVEKFSVIGYQAKLIPKLVSICV